MVVNKLLVALSLKTMRINEVVEVVYLFLFFPFHLSSTISLLQCRNIYLRFRYLKLHFFFDNLITFLSDSVHDQDFRQMALTVTSSRSYAKLARKIKVVPAAQPEPCWVHMSRGTKVRLENFLG